MTIAEVTSQPTDAERFGRILAVSGATVSAHDRRC